MNNETLVVTVSPVRNAETLIALVYRTKTNCRQYPFHSFEDLEKFCARRPYCDENLLVIPVLNRKALARGLVRAARVADFVKAAREAS